MRWSWPKEDLYWFLGQYVKSQGQIRTSNFVPFLHDNSITFWYTIMVLHTRVDHDPKRTSIDWGVNRSKSKNRTLNFAKFWLNNSIFWPTMRWYFTTVCMWSEEQPFDFWIKSQGQTCKVWNCCRGGGGGLSLLGQVSFSQLLSHLIHYQIQTKKVSHLVTLTANCRFWCFQHNCCIRWSLTEW